MRKILALLLACSVVSVSTSFAEEAVFDPVTGYRIARYRSPTPESVPGGKRIMAADVAELITAKHAILIDVMPSKEDEPIPKPGSGIY